MTLKISHISLFLRKKLYCIVPCLFILIPFIFIFTFFHVGSRRTFLINSKSRVALQKPTVLKISMIRKE